MKIKLKKIEQGVCPYCGSVDIDYGCGTLIDDYMHYPAECCECHRQFEEWYVLNFIGHNVGEYKQQPVDSGEEGVEIEY